MSRMWSGMSVRSEVLQKVRRFSEHCRDSSGTVREKGWGRATPLAPAAGLPCPQQAVLRVDRPYAVSTAA